LVCSASFRYSTSDTELSDLREDEVEGYVRVTETPMKWLNQPPNGNGNGNGPVTGDGEDGAGGGNMEEDSKKDEAGEGEEGDDEDNDEDEDENIIGDMSPLSPTVGRGERGERGTWENDIRGQKAVRKKSSTGRVLMNISNDEARAYGHRRSIARTRATRRSSEGRGEAHGAHPELWRARLRGKHHLLARAAVYAHCMQVQDTEQDLADAEMKAGGDKRTDHIGDMYMHTRLMVGDDAPLLNFGWGVFLYLRDGDSEEVHELIKTCHAADQKGTSPGAAAQAVSSFFFHALREDPKNGRKCLNCAIFTQIVDGDMELAERLFNRAVHLDAGDKVLMKRADTFIQHYMQQIKAGNFSRRMLCHTTTTKVGNVLFDLEIFRRGHNYCIHGYLALAAGRAAAAQALAAKDDEGGRDQAGRRGTKLAPKSHKKGKKGEVKAKRYVRVVAEKELRALLRMADRPELIKPSNRPLLMRTIISMLTFTKAEEPVEVDMKEVVLDGGFAARRAAGGAGGADEEKEVEALEKDAAVVVSRHLVDGTRGQTGVVKKVRKDGAYDIRLTTKTGTHTRKVIRRVQRAALYLPGEPNPDDGESSEDDGSDDGGGEDGVAEGNVGGKAVRGGATNPNKSAQQMRSADFVQRKEMVFDLRFKQVRSQGSVYLPV
jgi:hypothetical protein